MVLLNKVKEELAIEPYPDSLEFNLHCHIIFL
jgi:hypothetical protein